MNRLMNKVMVIGLFFALGGCESTTHSKSQEDVAKQVTYLDVYSGVEVIPAIVSNPHPVCAGEKPHMARLDKMPSLRVFVDTKSGEVCQ